ncbi:hypothetical protein ACXWO6_09190, partial [Streptococcus pyogenes]
KCAEYWSVHDEGIWAINIDPAYTGKIMFDTITKLNGNIGLSTTIAPWSGYHNQRGFMLDIIADTVPA